MTSVSFNLKALVYTSILLFAFFHLIAFDAGPVVSLASAWVLATYGISGIIFTYVRMKYGFLPGVGFHVLNNALAVIKYTVF